MVADICHCGQVNFNTADETLNQMVPSSSLDAYSGYSHRLLMACHDISELATQLEVPGSIDFDGFVTKLKEIISSLGSPVIEPDCQPCSVNITVAQISRLLYVAQRIRYAAFVFLHAVVDRAAEVYQVDPEERQRVHDQMPYTKDEALCGCLEMLSEIPIGKHCEFAGLALALFLVGCEVNDDRRRYLILDKLFVIERSFGLGHIARAKDGLMMIWQREQDGHRFWWKTMEEIGWELILC
ncbi:hypothetical protein VTK73DRAFT_1083 [Phialemonium thermophilum]|uniref:Uncharacterized protein n=1 Tax=Phialemonium thermophilum TaxID=223376 RepID=A0ABR3XAZ1_9PEZI